MINRSTFLRSMDADIGNRIVDDMMKHGVNALTQTTVKSAIKKENGKISVDLDQNGQDVNVEVDTVLVAIGRDANTSSLGLEEIGVKVDSHSRKVLSGFKGKESTSVDNIWAIGDVLDGVPELMPVAQKAGKLLAQRLHAISV